MKIYMNNCHHPRVQHPSERARAGYVSSVYLHHRSAIPQQQQNSRPSYPPVGVVKRAFFRSGMSASGIPSLQEVDGSNKGNGNDEVGSGIESSEAEMELCGAGTARARCFFSSSSLSDDSFSSSSSASSFDKSSPSSSSVSSSPLLVR
nr:hypothetical protein [Tanacetum cinerariifolium]